MVPLIKNRANVFNVPRISKFYETILCQYTLLLMRKITYKRRKWFKFS